MGRLRPHALGRRGTAVVLVAAVGYAIGVSCTRPFTLAADVITAVPLVLAASLLVFTLVKVEPSAAGPSTVAGPRQAGGNRSAYLWLIPIATITAWELYCLFNLPREQHPTLSVLIDMLDSTHVGKTLGFYAWLALGWFLVVR